MEIHKYKFVTTANEAESVALVSRELQRMGQSIT